MIGDDIHNCSEEELLRQSQGGSSAAFGVLAQRYRATLLGVLSRRRLPGVDAEDLVQETFARAYEAINSYDLTRPFSAWLTTIAVRVAATHQRRRKESVAESFEREDPSPSPAEIVTWQQERENLWALVGEVLPERQYEVLWLRYAREMSVRQVAGTMEISSIHVKVLLYRARRTLLKSERFCRAFGWEVAPAADGDVS